MTTLFPLILSDAKADATAFYSDLLGFDVLIDVGWYVQLQHPKQPAAQVAFMERDHSSLPAGFQADPAGVVITVEVDEVDPVHARAIELGLTLHGELRDEVWGQRHFITEDPTGLLVDVVQPIPPTPEFLEEHGLA